MSACNGAAPPRQAKPCSLLDAISLGDGVTELYIITQAATKHGEAARQVKAACDSAVRAVLGPHASVQAAGSRGKGTAITTSDFDLFVRRTPPISSREVTKAQAHAVGEAAVQQLLDRGQGVFTYRLGKVVTLVPPHGSLQFETDLAFDSYKGIVRQPPDQQLRQCPGLKLVVRCFKLMAEECGLPRIRAAHSLEQFVYATCSGWQPESIKLAAALPLCLQAVAGIRAVSQEQKEWMQETGLQQQAWRDYSVHLLQLLRKRNLQPGVTTVCFCCSAGAREFLSLLQRQ